MPQTIVKIKKGLGSVQAAKSDACASMSRCVKTEPGVKQEDMDSNSESEQGVDQR